MITIFEETGGELIAINTDYIRFIRPGESADCFIYMAHSSNGEKETIRVRGTLPEVVARLINRK